MLVRLAGRVKSPNLDDIVTATSDEAAVTGGSGAGRAADDTAGSGSGSPGDGVDAEAVSVERGVIKGRVLEFKNADVSVGRSAG